MDDFLCGYYIHGTKLCLAAEGTAEDIHNALFPKEKADPLFM